MNRCVCVCVCLYEDSIGMRVFVLWKGGEECVCVCVLGVVWCVFHVLGYESRCHLIVVSI